MEVSLGLGWLLISLHSYAPPLAAIYGQQFGSSGGKGKVSCRNCHPCHISKASWCFTSWVAGWAKSCSGHFPCPWWACQWWLTQCCFSVCLPQCHLSCQVLQHRLRGDPPGYVLPFACSSLGMRCWGKGEKEEVPLHVPLVWRCTHPPLYHRHLRRRRKANASSWLPLRLQYSNMACELPTAPSFSWVKVSAVWWRCWGYTCFCLDWLLWGLGESSHQVVPLSSDKLLLCYSKQWTVGKLSLLSLWSHWQEEGGCLRCQGFGWRIWRDEGESVWGNVCRKRLL